MDEKIKNKILKLLPNKQLLFGVSCVKRMEANLENYLINSGDASIFAIVSKLTDKIFFSCTLDQFNQIEELVSADDMELIEQIIPDTDENGSNEAVLAQNAAIALAYCLDFTKENNVDFINYCGLKVVETVDVIAFNILNLENSDLLISKELAIQNQVLKIINNMKSDFDSIDIEKFKLIVTQFKMG